MAEMAEIIFDGWMLDFVLNHLTSELAVLTSSSSDATRLSSNEFDSALAAPSVPFKFKPLSPMEIKLSLGKTVPSDLTSLGDRDELYDDVIRANLGVGSS